jgi:hypothetical protein
MGRPAKNKRKFPRGPSTASVIAGYADSITNASIDTGPSFSVPGSSIPTNPVSAADPIVTPKVHYGALKAPSAVPTTSFIVEVATFHSESDGTLKEEENHKIREEALKEFISRGQLDDLSKDVTINHKSKGVTDHLVTPLDGNAQLLEQKLGHARVTLDRTKRFAKMVSVQDGSDSDRSISCSIQGRSGDLGEKEKTKLYWNSLEAFRRMRAREADYPTGERIQASYIRALSDVGIKAKRYDPFNGKLQNDEGLSFGMCIQHSFNTDHKRLHMDLEVVPYISKGILRDMIGKILGQGFSNNPSVHIGVLTELLLDLEVQFRYFWPEKSSNNAKTLGTATGEDSCGLTFRIRNVKMPGEVPEFDAKGKSHLVQSFFEERKWLGF